MPITISIDQQNNPNHANGSNTQAVTSAITDTGAQSDLWSLEQFLASGFTHADLHPVNLSLSAANRSPIAIEGAFFARITTSRSGVETSCRSMVYVSSSVQAMYLSYETLLNLDLLGDFLSSKEATESGAVIRDKIQNSSSIEDTKKHQSSALHANRLLNNGCEKPRSSKDAACTCPQRTAPPSRPRDLPFPCTHDNNVKMKNWLLERYASSTFNTCPHHALPSMAGPSV